MKAKKNYSLFDVIPRCLNILLIICFFINTYYIVGMYQNGNTNDTPLPLKIAFPCMLAFYFVRKFVVMNFAPRDSKYYKERLFLQVDEVAEEMNLSLKEHKELLRKVLSMKNNSELIEHIDICNIARLIKKVKRFEMRKTWQ